MGQVSVQCHPAQVSCPEIPQELAGSGWVVEHRHVDVPCVVGAEGGISRAWSHPRIPQSLAPVPQVAELPPPKHSPVPVSTFTFCILPWARATCLSTGSMSSQGSASP